MKILVIAPERLPIPPYKGGSVETCIFEIFSRMSESEEITIISPIDESHPLSTSYHDRFLTILRVPNKSPRRYITQALAKVKTESFDLIQVENRPTYIPYVRKLYPDTPIILSLHSLVFMSKLSVPKAEYILEQVDGVLCVGKFVTATFRKLYPQYAEKFKAIYPGVDLDRFKPLSPCNKQLLRKKWREEGGKNILFVGRIVPKKGLHLLIRAVALIQAKHPRIRLIAVGSSWPGDNRITPYIRYVKRLAKQLGVNISFTGYISPAKMNEVYHLGDLFVFPTLYQEALGLVNLEALASEIPVIASNRGGVKEIVSHMNNGVLVNRYNHPFAYAEAIDKLLESPTLIEHFTGVGRNKIMKSFTWDHSVKTLKSYYTDIIGKQQKHQSFLFLG